MNTAKRQLALLAGVCLMLFAAGCLLSGTFTITEEFSFTASDSIYHYVVDITDEEDWEDHKDDIDRIDIVGFELWITNHDSDPNEFAIYLDDITDPELTTLSAIESGATRVFGDLAVAAGPDVTTHVTYGESLGLIHNVAKLRGLVKAGQFHYYGVTLGGGEAGLTVDSVRVVITFSASS